MNDSSVQKIKTDVKNNSNASSTAAEHLSITQESVNDSFPQKSTEENDSGESRIEEERPSSQDSNTMDLRNRNTIVNKNHDQEILIRSEYKCKVIKDIVDARFSQSIHKVLKAQNICRPMKIQRYMWPAVAMSLDVISISPSNSGKTYGYLVPILSYLTTQKKLPMGIAPTTLILCSSSSSVANIAALCDEFLSNYPDIRVVAALNGKSDTAIITQLLNGYHILVSTAPFLVRFINKYSKRNYIDLSSLWHIILDEGDVILEKYRDPVLEIFFKHKAMQSKQDVPDGELPQQLIAVGQQWTKGLSYFMEKFTLHPFVCIGSYMEAAAFSQILAKLSLVKSHLKNDKILEDLNKKDTTTEKTMILCTSVEESIKLNNFLQANKKRTLLAHGGDMSFNDIHGVKGDWAASVSGTYPILICTDDVLSDLNIKDVKWLIHYSVNLASKSRFYYRFSTIRDSWHKNATKCNVLIMVDDSNNVQFQGLIDIMRRLHTSVPEEWIKAANIITRNMDEDKKAYPICNNLKALGFCSKKSACPFRHCVLNAVDAPDMDISIGDTVELMVTYIHSATHVSARLVKCFKKGTKEPNLYSSDVSTRFSSDMQTYFSNVKNRRARRTIEVGDICAMEDTLDHYVRIKVLNIVSRNDFNEPFMLTVMYMDYRSDFLKVKASQLLEIPEELAKRQLNFLEVFVSGLEPYDREYEWDQCANEAVENWFKKYYDSTHSVVGKVALHLGNSIWVNTLECRTKVSGFPEYTLSSLRRYLIDNNHAKENSEHLQNLHQLHQEN